MEFPLTRRVEKEKDTAWFSGLSRLNEVVNWNSSRDQRCILSPTSPRPFHRILPNKTQKPKNICERPVLIDHREHACINWFAVCGYVFWPPPVSPWWRENKTPRRRWLIGVGITAKRNLAYLKLLLLPQVYSSFIFIHIMCIWLAVPLMSWNVVWNTDPPSVYMHKIAVSVSYFFQSSADYMHGVLLKFHFSKSRRSGGSDKLENTR